MPSTTPDLRMATARGFVGSGLNSGLGALPNISRGKVSERGSSFGSAFGSADLAGFGSDGHMASKFGASGARGGADGGGAGQGARPSPASAPGAPEDSGGVSGTSSSSTSS